MPYALTISFELPGADISSPCTGKLRDKQAGRQATGLSMMKLKTQQSVRMMSEHSAHIHTYMFAIVNSDALGSGNRFSNLRRQVNKSPAN